ncbi:hypothetical protein DTO027B3_3402 [Paecilomyces variotii]|nr:hypothetical protein DTO027B3_3402 [Paecilomyces variotii]
MLILRSFQYPHLNLLLNIYRLEMKHLQSICQAEVEEGVDLEVPVVVRARFNLGLSRLSQALKNQTQIVILNADQVQSICRTEVEEEVEEGFDLEVPVVFRARFNLGLSGLSQALKNQTRIIFLNADQVKSICRTEVKEGVDLEVPVVFEARFDSIPSQYLEGFKPLYWIQIALLVLIQSIY